ncbi:MAG: helix-turn-helix domain-containing protein [Dehalococcoidia bacterium]|nr:helix-turn-helix domain-containing protein [Dehalococcoidia bacterium]
MVGTFEENLARELRDPEFAKLYGAADAKSEFAIALARARDKAGVTQKELADRLGVSQAYIAKLSAGDANPTLGAVGRMLAALGFSLRMDVEPLLGYEITNEHTRKGELVIADGGKSKGSGYNVRTRKRPL